MRPEEGWALCSALLRRFVGMRAWWADVGGEVVVEGRQQVWLWRHGDTLLRWDVGAWWVISRSHAFLSSSLAALMKKVRWAGERELSGVTGLDALSAARPIPRSWRCKIECCVRASALDLTAPSGFKKITPTKVDMSLS